MRRFAAAYKRAMTIEKRAEVREPVKLPVSLADGSTGTTRDFSASGLFFECHSELGLGSEISFNLELDGLNRPLQLVARGLIVRVEQKSECTGVGVKMLASKFISG